MAAATCGETRCVRPPLPCRPSKLRLEVDAERSPGASWSGFMPRHIEQPACRHSAPASVKTLSRPSSTACSATRTEPGTTSIRTPSATLRPSRIAAAARRSSMRPLVQEPTKTVSTLMSRSGCPARQPHVLQGLFGGVALRSVLVRSRVGDVRRQRRALAGVGAPGDERRQRGGVDDDLGVEDGVVVGAQRLPVRDRGVPVLALGGVGAALEVVEGGLVGGDHARAGAGLDRHVADGHPGLHRELLDGGAAVLQDVALAAAGADPGDDRQDQVLGGDAVGQFALDRDRHGLGAGQRQRLGGQHVLDLAGADAERQRAEGAVGGGVGVTADDGGAGLGQAQLRAHDVHDALLDVAQRVQPYAELGAVLAQRLQLGAGDRVRDRLVDVEGRGVVVLGRDGEVEAAHLAAGLPQAVEGLGAGHLVQQVQIDEEEVGLALGAPDDVVVPDLLRECPTHRFPSGRPLRRPN